MNMKTIITSKNTRLSLAVCCALALAGCGQKSAEEYLAQAEAYVQSGSVDSAVIELKNALSVDPSNRDARLALGKLYIRTGELGGASKELERARENGIAPEAVVPFMAEAYFYADDHEAVLTLVRDAASLSSESAQRVNVFAALADQALSNEGDRVQFELDKSALSGDSVTIVSALAAWQGGDFVEASRLLQSVDEGGAYKVEKHYLLGVINSDAGDFGQAVSAYQKVTQAIPALNSIQYRLLDALIRTQDYDAAEGIIGQFLARDKNATLANYYRAVMLYRQGDFDNAFVHIERAASKGLRSSSVSLMSGLIAYNQEKYERAYDALIQVDPAKHPSVNLDRLLAAIQLKLGYKSEIFDTVKSIDDLSEADASLVSAIGLELLESGEAEQGADLLKLASELDPQSAEVQLKQGYGQYTQGEGLAIETLREVLTKDKSLSQGWMLLVSSLLDEKKFDEALDVTQKWQQENVVDGKTMEGAVYFAQGDFDKALKTYNEALAQDAKHLGANLYKLKLLVAMQDSDAVYAQSRTFAELAPGRAEGYSAMLATAVKLDVLTEASDWLATRHAQDKENALLTQFFGHAKYLQGDLEGAIALHESVETLANVGYISLGNAYVKSRQLGKTIPLYQKWVEEEPGYRIPWIRLITMQKLAGDNRGAMETVREALKFHEGATQIKNQGFGAAVKAGDLSQARTWQNELLAVYADGSYVPFDKNRAEYAVANKDYASAEKLARELYSQSQQFDYAVLLAQALQGLGRSSEAGPVLEEAWSKFRDVSGISTHLVAEFFNRNNNLDKAEYYYLQRLQTKQDDVVALNNLSSVLIKKEQYESALEYARKAVATAPDVAVLKDNLGVAMFKMGNTQEAFDTLLVAHKAEPDVPVLAIHLAEVSIALGNKRLASELLNGLGQMSRVDRENMQRVRRLL